MNCRIHLLIATALLFEPCAIAAGTFNSNHSGLKTQTALGGILEPVSSSDTSGFWQAPVTDIPTVLAVQRKLRAEGYDPGPADGTVNAKTVQAVKDAQKDRE